MRIIGITGGIGTGKSEIGKILNEQGIMVIDADKVAHDIIKSGEDAFNELVSEFGIEIIDLTGEIDRKKLRNIVFNDKIKLEKLNLITHKYVIKKINEIVRKNIDKRDFNIIAIECPIPVKEGFLDIVNEVWVVEAPIEVRVERIKKRSGLSEEEIIKIVQNQPEVEKYRMFADKVIFNDGDLEKLVEQVKNNLN